MKLHFFLDNHVDAILDEWDTFAQTLSPAADSMTLLALRDHAKEILRAIALDIQTSQSAAEQRKKSLGHSPGDHPERSAASLHGSLRQASAFTLLQLSAEYRALRASVLRLWLPHVSTMSADTVAEITRFNESIDQALAESIVTFSAQAERTKDLFLAILGHDLRAPIATMSMAGEILTRSDVTVEAANMVGARVRRSALVMSVMIEDLLGYTGTQLRSGIPVTLSQTSIEAACNSAIANASAVHPGTEYRLNTEGELHGEFDHVRLHQLFTNLLVNAAQYGEKGKPVTINARRQGQSIVVETINYGAVIPEEAKMSIFKPLVQLDEGTEEDRRPRTSLGLGLFIAREIAEAHGGSITVTSNANDGTNFRVVLPLKVELRT
ncbi:MAG: two-component sensor histidine kinase [Herminiimonas sp.]|nr:two-component sensor histidine kinase [Herminiimonas sp.]